MLRLSTSFKSSSVAKMKSKHSGMLRNKQEQGTIDVYK